MLLNTVTGGGNLLLNVGPDPLGLFPPASVQVLEAMGRFLAAYGESIYDTRGGPYPSWTWGGSTHRGNVVYVHVQHWPLIEDRLRLPISAGTTLLSAELLTGGTVDASVKDGLIHLVVPTDQLHPIDTIVKLTFDKPLVFEG